MMKWLVYKAGLNNRASSNKVMLGKSFSNVKKDSTFHSSVDAIGKITYVNTLVGVAGCAHTLGVRFQLF